MCAEKSVPLTELVLDRIARLQEQSLSFANLVGSMRNRLGIYDLPASISNWKQSDCSTPSDPTLTDAARRLQTIIFANDETLNNFEKLLKNV